MSWFGIAASNLLLQCSNRRKKPFRFPLTALQPVHKSAIFTSRRTGLCVGKLAIEGGGRNRLEFKKSVIAV